MSPKNRAELGLCVASAPWATAAGLLVADFVTIPGLTFVETWGAVALTLATLTGWLAGSLITAIAACADPDRSDR